MTKSLTLLTSASACVSFVRPEIARRSSSEMSSRCRTFISALFKRTLMPDAHCSRATEWCPPATGGACPVLVVSETPVTGTTEESSVPVLTLSCPVWNVAAPGDVPVCDISTSSTWSTLLDMSIHLTWSSFAFAAPRMLGLIKVGEGRHPTGGGHNSRSGDQCSAKTQSVKTTTHTTTESK